MSDPMLTCNFLYTVLSAFGIAYILYSFCWTKDKRNRCCYIMIKMRFVILMDVNILPKSKQNFMSWGMLWPPWSFSKCSFELFWKLLLLLLTIGTQRRRNFFQIFRPDKSTVGDRSRNLLAHWIFWRENGVFFCSEDTEIPGLHIIKDQ